MGGESVKSTNGVASGPISFMKVFNAATEAVKQGGKRRGANMAVLRIDHPDIEEFITCKDKDGDISNFNISVGVTDDFMNAVAKGEDFALIHPHNGEVAKTVDAQKLFELLYTQAWKNGEPGILFLDTINDDHPIEDEIEASNPCGETPLLPNESCNLGSINLSNFYDSIGNNVDYARLANACRMAVRFLDNIIDLNSYPLPEIAAATQRTRKIGLGIMGFADLLIKMKIRYGSPESIDLAKTIIGFMHEEAVTYSMELAEDYGPYPAYKEEYGHKQRNATVITIAPTGTLSIIAGCSGGIEPNFAFKYIRRVMDTELEEVHPLYPKEGPVPDYFVTAQDIPPEEHVNMQAAFQEYTDNAISKTINMSSDATPEDVRKVFEQAYNMDCKGITVYRDGSRANQVLDTNNGTKSRPKARPTSLDGTTSKIKTGCGTMFGTINHDESGVCELFTRIGKSGGCAAAFTEATSRVVSIALRSGVHIDEIIGQLKNIHCPNGTWDNGTRIFSCPDAMARLLLRHLDKDEPQETTNMPCPECQSPMIKESGCYRCTCGYSRCG